MFVHLSINADDLIKRAEELGAAEDQMPYIFARTLNDAAEATRSFLIGTTWPSNVTARNRSFMSAALSTRDSRAQKGDLTVEIFDRLDRGSLKLHAEGGRKMPKGGNLAIGGRNVTRTARGVAKSQRPRNLRNSVKIGDVIYQRQKDKRLRLMYVLRPTAQIKRDVPFYRDFEINMRDGILNSLPRNVELAMRTSR